MGKGRQIAGLLYENFLRGRKKVSAAGLVRSC